MNHTLEGLQQQRQSARALASVVSTMKALAASKIGQYEAAVDSLADYARAVQLGMLACRQKMNTTRSAVHTKGEGKSGAVIFGSDQGLVGRFNEVICEKLVHSLGTAAPQTEIWAVGERIAGSLADASLPVAATFAVPNSVQSITLLVAELLLNGLAQAVENRHRRVLVFHNRPVAGRGYEPTCLHLLPFDQHWLQQFEGQSWPGSAQPEVIGGSLPVLGALIREYLFVSLFRACAESLMSENSTRLSAMQRAEKNVEERLEKLTQLFHSLRQKTIDDELFDLVSGFEAGQLQ